MTYIDDIYILAREKEKELQRIWQEERTFRNKTIEEILKAGSKNYGVKIPRYDPKTIFDEEKSVRWNAEETNRRNASIRGKFGVFARMENDAMNDFREGAKSYINNMYKLSLSQAAIIYDAAYEDGHSAGFGEIASYIDKYAQLAERLMDVVE